MGVLTVIGAIIGALCLVFSFFVGGAPQQAALAAMACAFAIIPYVMYRVGQLGDAERRDKAILQLLRERLPDPEARKD